MYLVPLAATLDKRF